MTLSIIYNRTVMAILSLTYTGHLAVGLCDEFAMQYLFSRKSLDAFALKKHVMVYCEQKGI